MQIGFCLRLRLVKTLRILLPDGEMPFTLFDLSSALTLPFSFTPSVGLLVKLLDIDLYQFLALKIGISKDYYGYHSFTGY